MQFIYYLGQTKQIAIGDYIQNYSEIFTELGSQLSFTDYHDHQYHLSGSGHLEFENNKLKLKSGYLWLQSFNQEEPFYVETANAYIKYTGGESIISFDSYNEKSQIISLQGKWKFANKFEQFRSVLIPSGTFSFISQKYNDGTPRRPTIIGKSSYRKVTSLFSEVKPLTEQSIHNFKSLVKKPETKVRRINRLPASVMRKKQKEKEIKSAMSLIQDIARGGRQKTKKNMTKKKPTDSFLRYYQSRLTEMKKSKKRKKNN